MNFSVFELRLIYNVWRNKNADDLENNHRIRRKLLQFYLIFYILFEAILIPMYFLIGVFGSRDRKIRASYLLFLYTLVSSIVMFISILFLYVKYGTTNYIILSTVKIDPLFENLC